ncbi:putative beta-D-xylosidase 7 [Nymphaea thermarum]|nr:putative beta-D-xylosidase 7 [Nymphaea thermarum]
MEEVCSLTRHALLRLLFLLPLLLAAASSRPPFACDPADPATRSHVFCRTSLPLEVRVRDLVSRLTLDEKVTQLVNSAPGVPRLGIPAYDWWSESLHGVSGSGRGIHFDGSISSATSFPQVILTAASFNVLHWYQIGQAIGFEARALYNAGQATGLTFWAPNINIFRDPRWGRGQETPGEDPLTSSRYAAAYVRGLQGAPLQGNGRVGPLRASACCKHFTAYDLDNWKGTTRYVFNAIVSAQDLADTYQPPFQSCVEQGQASGIMCSYNRVNGVPSCADYNLLSATARQHWGFNGYITSDCDAVSIIHDAQYYAATAEDAVGDVLKAGMDVNCGNYLLQHTKSAVQQGKVRESDLNRALHNLFSVRMRLGLFDGEPSRHPYFGSIHSGQICSPAHQNLALEAARDGIVLLKNSGRLLPLSRSRVRSLAVIGPNANDHKVLVGNYAGPPCKAVTPFEGLQRYVTGAHYSPGCDSVGCSSDHLIGQAVNAASGADHVILVMGLDQTQEREELDRLSLLLPGQQQKLIESVAAAARVPVVLVLLCGGPVDVSFAKYNRKIGSILWAGYPGEAGGTALAEVIFGDHNPGGRLPMTWYPESFTAVPMTDMRMRPDPRTGYPGRTYRFYTGREVFRFGSGLSYSTYSYEFVSVTNRPLHLSGSSEAVRPASEGAATAYHYDVEKLGVDACDQMRFSATVRVSNNGTMDGRHAVLLFSRGDNDVAAMGSPKKQLVGFQSTHVKAGERAEVEFVVEPCEHLSSAMEDGTKILRNGAHYLIVGDTEHQLTILA